VDDSANAGYGFNVPLILRHVLIGVGVVMACGCGDRLETGYKPRRLGDSELQRRAYYASPFSPEAQVPNSDRAAPMHRRPNTN
jgi:hypothetical protein